ncbi:alpha/beta hydrolase [Corynebacterium godavarianum]|nr:alpha/beta hydrolase family protein [Corynebacterium godavarianum]
MKFTRPALAAVAAVAVAAAAVPAGIHLSADSEEGTQPAQIAAAQSTTSATVPETTESTESTAPTETTDSSESSASSASSAPSEPTSDAEPDAKESDSELTDANGGGASNPTGDEGEVGALIDDVLSGPETDPDKLNNMQEERATSAGTVKPLTRSLPAATGGTQEWVDKIKLFDGGEAVEVYSPSMERDIPVAIIRATDDQGNYIKDAPTYYLLNGAGGSEQDTDWIAQAGGTLDRTLGHEPVNVVIPMEGAFSYYVDWLTEPDKNRYMNGKQLWSTFLAKELPQSIEPYMDTTNDRRAVSGFSMSATSSLLLAEHNPGFYKAVGSFSGCAATSRPLPWFFVGLTVNRGGGLTPDQLWGPMGSEYNRYNDALVMAEYLKGTDLYISSGTGLVSETDTIGYLKNQRNLESSRAFSNHLTLLVEGGVIEGAMNACTHDLRAKLDAKGIPAHYNFRATGTHSWPSWLEDMRESWATVIRPALLPDEPETTTEKDTPAAPEKPTELTAPTSTEPTETTTAAESSESADATATDEATETAAPTETTTADAT